MTFTDLRTEIMDRLNLSSTEAQTRIGRAINRKYRTVTSSIGMQLSRRTTTSKAVSIGSPLVSFSGVEKIINVVNRNVSPYRVLEEVSIEELQASQPGSSSDNVKKFAIYSHTSETVTILLDVNPLTGFTLYADVHLAVADLSGSAEPAFPESFHDVLIEGVLFDEYRKLEKPALAVAAKGEYDRLLSDLKFWVAKSSMDVYQGKLANQQPSKLGSGGGGSASSFLGGHVPNTIWIGDTSNANMSLGLTINQGANDDQILTLKSSVINTGITSALSVEPDDFSTVSKQFPSTGGLRLRGIGEDDAAQIPNFRIESIGGRPDTVKGVSGRGLLEQVVYQHNGANSLSNITAGGNIVALRAFVGGAEQTQWLLDEDGDTWQNGTIDISSATGGQIKFPATQNASSDANTLDDYEEGFWTPIITGTAGSGITYNSGLTGGIYVKIGKFVLVYGRVVLTSRGTVTGNASLIGFPFTTSLYGPVMVSYWANLNAAITYMGGIVPGGTATGFVLYHSAGTSANILNTTVDGTLGNTADLFFGCVYTYSG